MKYAIVEMGGHQFWFEIEKYYDLNYFPIFPGKKIFLNRILFVNTEKNLFIGNPYLKNLCIEANIVNHFKGSKIIVYKMKRKKKVRRKWGHRQKLTRILINKIAKL